MIITKFKYYENVDLKKKKSIEYSYDDPDVDFDSLETGSDDDWKLGSYVLVTLKNIVLPPKEIPKNEKSIMGRITKWRTDEEFPYEVTFSSGFKFEFNGDEIIRYLNNDEIEKYKLELKSSKFNL